MNLKLDKADTTFSKYIRLRDKRCVRCGRMGHMNADGEPINGLQCSHFFGRSKESTRFDPENCDTLCFGCHQQWGSTNTEAYREFKIKQLGEERFKKLRIRAELLQKKDRKLSYLFVKKLLESLNKK